MASSIKSNHPGTILIVEPILSELRLLEAALTEKGYAIRSARNGESALNIAKSTLPSLILLDVSIPDMNGYEICQKLKINSITTNIPVIFVSEQTAAEDKVKAFDVGGIDYICKPLQYEEVLARISSHLALQATYDEVLTQNKLLQESLQQQTLQLEVINARLQYNTLHDRLTSLPNRTLLLERLEHAIERSLRWKSPFLAVFSLDLDDFKAINDSLGHRIGDRIIQEFSHRLQSFQRPGDTIARIGGDEFVIIIEELNDASSAAKIAERLLQNLAAPIRFDDREFFITSSIGIVVRAFEKSQIFGEEGVRLLRDADVALSRAKRRSHGSYEVFDASMHRQAARKLQLANNLRRGIERQEFVVYYQPIVRLNNNQISGIEALVRWQPPLEETIAPNEFIPLAEETGMISAIDQFVMLSACQQLNDWRQRFPSISTLTLNLNLSSKHFSHPGLIDFIDQLLEQTGLDGQSLKLEITESALIENTEVAIRALSQLQERQIGLALDDFGTGYSSLSYLHRFPFNTLKIDRSFIHELEKSHSNREIVRAIVNIGLTLEMDIVAEGIETTEQRDYLSELGCSCGQGYLFSRPQNSQAITNLLLS